MEAGAGTVAAAAAEDISAAAEDISAAEEDISAAGLEEYTLRVEHISAGEGREEFAARAEVEFPIHLAGATSTARRRSAVRTVAESANRSSVVFRVLPGRCRELRGNSMCLLADLGWVRNRAPARQDVLAARRRGRTQERMYRHIRAGAIGPRGMPIVLAPGARSSARSGGISFACETIKS